MLHLRRRRQRCIDRILSGAGRRASEAARRPESKMRVRVTRKKSLTAWAEKQGERNHTEKRAGAKICYVANLTRVTLHRIMFMELLTYVRV